MNFEQKIVLVTGATRNTGKAIAEAFAEHNAVVCVNGRERNTVEKVCESLQKSCDSQICPLIADISDIEVIKRMFEKIKQKYGKLDILVNNAVIQGTGFGFTETPPDLTEKVLKINILGTYYCSQYAAKLMLKQNKGVIINIGSNTSERAISGRSAYIASKGAVNALTRAMAIELGPKGIRVNCVSAGYIHTDRWNNLSEKIKKRRRKNIPVGKEATGKDIANVVLFMASDMASKINGTCLVIDGGVSSQLVPVDCDL